MAEVPNTPIWETWESALLKTMSVGADIQEAIRQGKIPNIDKIAVIPRGGLFVVDVLARQLGLSGDKVLSIGLSKYSRDDPKHAGEFKKGQMPTDVDVEGQVILLGDEVFDTCETAVRAKSILLELGALSVITAAIHYKPGKNETDFVPDFYAELTDGWVYYPWEVIDPIGTLHRLATNGSHP